MKKHEFLYKSLVVLVSSVFVLVLANVAFADTVTPNFTSVGVDQNITAGGDVTAGGTLDVAGGLELGSTPYTAYAGQIKTSGLIISGSYIRATSYLQGSYLRTNTWYPRTGNTLSLPSTAYTLNANYTDFNVESVTTLDNVTALGAVVTDTISSTTGATGDVYMNADVDASSSDVDVYTLDVGSTSTFDGSANFDGTVYVGDEITLNPTYGSVGADEIGSFYIEADHCDATECSGSYYYNYIEVFCNAGDIAVACEGYAYEGSNEADLAFGLYPFENTHPAVVTWSPGFDSCVTRVDDDDAGIWVQALCFDPEGLTNGGYSAPSQYNIFE